MAADTLIHRAIISLAVGHPLIWEHPPAGVGIDAPMILQALGACQPGDWLMHEGCKIGRIGKAGIPLPTFHYHLDDDEYPACLSEHGEIYREWQIWTVMLVQSSSFRVVSTDGEAIETEVEQPHPQSCSHDGDQVIHSLSP
jgi:hypothetical protein